MQYIIDGFAVIGILATVTVAYVIGVMKGSRLRQEMRVAVAFVESWLTGDAGEHEEVYDPRPGFGDLYDQDVESAYWQAYDEAEEWLESQPVPRPILGVVREDDMPVARQSPTRWPGYL